MLTTVPVLLAAWRTGFSLENVSLRADAFDYLQLPFKLLSGRAGRIQVQASGGLRLSCCTAAAKHYEAVGSRPLGCQWLMDFQVLEWQGWPGVAG